MNCASPLYNQNGWLCSENLLSTYLDSYTLTPFCCVNRQHLRCVRDVTSCLVPTLTSLIQFLLNHTKHRIAFLGSMSVVVERPSARSLGTPCQALYPQLPVMTRNIELFWSKQSMFLLLRFAFIDPSAHHDVTLFWFTWALKVKYRLIISEHSKSNIC